MPQYRATETENCTELISNYQNIWTPATRSSATTVKKIPPESEGLGVFPVPRSSRWSWSLHLFLGRPMFLRPFGLYCSACFGSLFVSILCTCCSHFSWYSFISFTMFCAPVFCPIHWFFSLSSFVVLMYISVITWRSISRDLVSIYIHVPL